MYADSQGLGQMLYGLLAASMWTHADVSTKSDRVCEEPVRLCDHSINNLFGYTIAIIGGTHSCHIFFFYEVPYISIVNPQ